MQIVLMSATLDSALLAAYFGNCPTLAAGGRTFPVEHFFLEDVYEMTGYALDPDAPAAMRGSADLSRQKALAKRSSRHQTLIKVLPLRP